VAVIACDSASQRIYTEQNTLMQTTKLANYICITEYRGPLGSSAAWYSKSRIEIPTQEIS